MQAVRLGIKGKQASFFLSSGNSQVYGTARIMCFQQILFQSIRNLIAKIIVKFGALLAALNVEHGLSVGRFHQPDAGRRFKFNALEIGFKIQHGGFMPVEQTCRTDFAQRSGRDAHACELLPVHLFHAPFRGLLRGGFVGGGSLLQFLRLLGGILFRLQPVFAKHFLVFFGVAEQGRHLLGIGQQFRRKVVETEVGRVVKLPLEVGEEGFEDGFAAVDFEEITVGLGLCQRAGFQRTVLSDALHHVGRVTVGSVGHYQHFVFHVLEVVHKLMN